MADFEQVLAASTARGANEVPGCVLAAVDKNGKSLYLKAAGFNGVAPDAEPISIDATFWIASCTKLLGTVAALQCVERGQITLDEPVSKVLPELAELEILHAEGDIANLKLSTTKTSNQITLRQLLCHSSGLAYDIFTPSLMAWRASRGESPRGLDGVVAAAHTVPLSFEPGQGWAYSGGIDWAGLIVARLHNTTLEEYMQKNIFAPLGMNSTTFRFEKHPDIQKRLVKTAARGEDGKLTEAKKPFVDNAPEDCAGGGLYSSAQDYVKVLGDLIKDQPILLKRETVEKEMFAPQLPKGSSAHNGLLASTDILAAMTGATKTPEGVNWGLGGLYMGDDVGAFKKGTLTWGGYPNLTWFMHREKGVAGIYASQVVPPGDPKSSKLSQQWMAEIFRTASA